MSSNELDSITGLEVKSRIFAWLDRGIIYLLMLLVFGIPLTMWPGVGDPTVPKTSFFLVAMLALAVLWGLASWLRPCREVRVPWVFFPLAFLGLVGLISLLAAVNARESVRSLLIAALYVELLLIIADSVRRRRDVHLLLYALLASGFLVGLYGLLQYFGMLPSPSYGVGPAAMTSTFGNQNHLGGFLSYMIFPCAMLFLVDGSFLRRSLAVLAWVFVLVVVVLVNQMGILFALLAGAVVGLILVVLARSRVQGDTWRRIAMLCLAVALVAGAVIVVRIEPGMGGRKDPAYSVDAKLGIANVDARLLFWAVGARMLSDHPVTGIGLGNYKVLYTRYEALVQSSRAAPLFPDVTARTELAHNEFVQTAAELGIGGLVGLFSVLGVVGAATWVRIRRSSYVSYALRDELILLTVGLAVATAHALISFPLHLPSSALVVCVLMGLVFSSVFGQTRLSQVVLPRCFWRGAVVVLVLLGTAGAVLGVRDMAGMLRFLSGYSELHIGHTSQAVAMLERSVELSFSPRCNLYYLGVAQARSEMYEEALESFRRCLTSCPADRAYLLYADLASQLGELVEAREAIETLLTSNTPADLRTAARLIQAQIEQLSGSNDVAITLLEKLLESDPSEWKAHLALGDIFAAEGKSSEARAHYQAGIALIDEKEHVIQLQLNSSSAIPLSEYGTITSTLRSLERERARAEEALRDLMRDDAP